MNESSWKTGKSLYKTVTYLSLYFFRLQKKRKERKRQATNISRAEGGGTCERPCKRSRTVTSTEVQNI